MQDIAKADSVKAIQTFLNTLFDLENMANFYTIGFSFFLTYYHFKKRKDLTIKNNTSQPLDDLAPRQKWKIIRHDKSKELY